MSLCELVFFSLGRISRSGIARSYKFMFNFLGNCQIFSIGSIPFYIPTLHTTKLSLVRLCYPKAFLVFLLLFSDENRWALPTLQVPEFQDSLCFFSFPNF